MPNLPALPPSPAAGAWSVRIHRAHQILVDAYHHASSVLHSQSDAQRIRIHAETIQADIIPVLFALGETAAAEPVPVNWILDCTSRFGELLVSLHNAEQTQHGQCVLVLQLSAIRPLRTLI